MSRNIPNVRLWRVAFYDGGKLLGVAHVRTINKRFAKWFANERLGYIALKSTRVTCAVLAPIYTAEMAWRADNIKSE